MSRSYSRFSLVSLLPTHSRHQTETKRHFNLRQSPPTALDFRNYLRLITLLCEGGSRGLCVDMSHPFPSRTRRLSLLESIIYRTVTVWEIGSRRIRGEKPAHRAGFLVITLEPHLHLVSGRPNKNGFRSSDSASHNHEFSIKAPLEVIRLRRSEIRECAGFTSVERNAPHVYRRTRSERRQ